MMELLLMYHHCMHHHHYNFEDIHEHNYTNKNKNFINLLLKINLYTKYRSS